jgi:ubiquinone/menaquinone biosynthesis C-methylase UbiE
MTMTELKSPPRQPKAFASDARSAAAASAVKAAWWAANGLIARRIAQPNSGAAARRFEPKTPPASQVFLRNAWFEAFRKDAEDVAAGLYPLTERPPEDLSGPFRRSADFLRDAKAVDARRRRKGGVEARDDGGDEVRSESYPGYYRQNFHYQSGGWFTAESAARYETQVEALFSGAAGAMRRRALSLLAKAWRERDQRGLKLLDLACGSGAFLNDLRAAFPRAQVMGLDLSPAYLKEAGRRSKTSRVQGLAEKLPFADDSLDGVACVYLFHELPPRVRPTVAAEIARVLKPGGVLAFADSVQTEDAPAIARLLEAFPAFFHEPYYGSYQSTNLQALFTGAGLVFEATDQAFLTKALLFKKPDHPNSSI